MKAFINIVTAFLLSCLSLQLYAGNTMNNKTNDDTPEVLVSCMTSCTMSITVRISSPNSATISNSTAQGLSSTAIITPLFITANDEMYVEAVISHGHGYAGTHTLEINNSHEYVERISFDGGSYTYRGYIPLARTSSTERLNFIVTTN